MREVPINAANIDSNCPCASYAGFPAPSYLGDNWYCESGNPDPFNPWPPNLLSNDLLWDGENCEGTCCSNGKSPPWFSVVLPAPLPPQMSILKHGYVLMSLVMVLKISLLKYLRYTFNKTWCRIFDITY